MLGFRIEVDGSVIGRGINSNVIVVRRRRKGFFSVGVWPLKDSLRRSGNVWLGFNTPGVDAADIIPAAIP
jgi:hypothetical protein